MKHSFDEALFCIQSWKPSDEMRAQLKGYVVAQLAPQPADAVGVKVEHMLGEPTESKTITNYSRALWVLACSASAEGTLVVPLQVTLFHP